MKVMSVFEAPLHVRPKGGGGEGRRIPKFVTGLGRVLSSCPGKLTPRERDST
jgi:hypothetical protein